MIAGTVLAEQLMLGAALVIVLVATAFVTSVPQLGVPRAGRARRRARCCSRSRWPAMTLLSRYRRARTRPRPTSRASGGAPPSCQLGSVAHGLSHGLRMFRDPRPAAIALVAALVSWLTQIAGIYWTLEAFGIRKGVSAAALVFLVSTLVQLFPIVPGQHRRRSRSRSPTRSSQTYNVDYTTRVRLLDRPAGDRGRARHGLGFVFLSREGLSLAEARRLPARE